MAQSDGTITFSTQLDNETLEKQLAEVTKTIRGLQEQLTKGENEKSALEEQAKALHAEYDKAAASVEKMAQELEKLKAEGADDAVIEMAQGSHDAFKKGLEDTSTQIYNVETKLGNVTDKNAQLERQLKEATAAAGILHTEMNKVANPPLYKKAGDSIKKHIVAAAASASKAFARLKQIITSVFIFSLITPALQKFRSWMGEVIAQDAEASRAIASLKMALQALAMPIIQAIIPAFTKFVNILTVAIGYIAKAVNAIFGTTIDKSIAAAEKLNNKQKDTAKNIKETGKQAKAASRYLAGFDELTLQASGSETNTASPLGDLPEKNDKGKFDEKKIDEKMKKLMTIIAGALIVIGVILCFTGVGILLGLTLIAIGAAMLYGIYKEDWDKLPEDVKNKIKMIAMLIVGIALLVIGLILCLTGVGILIGLALMALGAFFIAKAAKEAWDKLPEEMKNKIKTIAELIVGVALVIIGLILCMTGVGIPLGIALIAAGAVVLAHVIATNWDGLSEPMQNAITKVLVIVGIAAVVIGLLLALTGVNLPLGIAMILLGAAALFGAVALNWDTLGPILREHLDTILTVAGIAAIVIGLILCLTGVGAPVGVALILAGAGAIIGAVALNWDFFKEKIAEIWAGVKGFWDEHIRPIFTVQWWADKAHAIAEGLKSGIKAGINGAIGLLNRFIGWVNEKLHLKWDALTIAGKEIVPAADFQLFTLPQIPQLARGAVIPPNQEFLATLGDQTSGNNLETPEGLMRQIVREEVGSSEITTLLQSILDAVENGHILMVDKRILGQVAQEQIHNMARMGGYA